MSSVRNINIDMILFFLFIDFSLERGDKYIYKIWRMGIIFNVEIYYVYDEVKERLILIKEIGRRLWFS